MAGSQGRAIVSSREGPPLAVSCWLVLLRRVGTHDLCVRPSQNITAFLQECRYG